jgi:glucose-6-phosphate 1-dehydrogenase
MTATDSSSQRLASGARPRADALVLFGATGDLAFKKLFPALYQLSVRQIGRAHV